MDNSANTSALINYPVLILLNSENFDFLSAASNGDDVRVTADDGVSEIDFWIESFDGGSEHARIWAEVPNIPDANLITVYLYYNNPVAPAAGSGQATFDFFDDFSSSALDTAKWYSGGTPTLQNGIITINSSGEYIRSKQTFLYKALQCKSRFASYANYGYIGFNKVSLSVGSTDAMFLCFNTPTVQSITSTGGFTWGYNQYEGTDWHQWSILWKSGQVDFKVDGTLRRSHITNVPSAALYAQINDNSGSPVIETDWLFVRNYSSPEPVAIVGSAETAPALPRIVSLPLTESYIGEQYVYDVNAVSDTQLMYDLLICPDGMTIDPNTGHIEWTPLPAQVGNHEIIVRATNTFGSTSQAYTLSASVALAKNQWNYSRLLTIDNSANSDSLVDYPVKITLTGENFDFDASKDNGQDVRFTKADGLTTIDHWIEKWDRVSQNAVVWVKVPSIPALSISSLYMYYGNADASDISDGTATFDFFDDFEQSVATGPVLEGNWQRVVVDDTLDGSHNILAENVDQDERMDLIAAAYRDQSVVWYKQPDDPVSGIWQRYTIDGLLENAHDIQSGDIDGDGLRDVVGLSLSSAWQNYGLGEGYICWYKKPLDPASVVSSTGWTELAPLPYSQGDGAAAIYSGEIYVFGGHYLGVSDPRNESFKYNPGTNTWTQLSNMPTKRWGHVAVEFDGLIHVFAGQTLTSATGIHEIYDPNTDTWLDSDVTDVPTTLANQGLMAIRYQDRIHLFYKQYHYAYDPVSDAYSPLANVPTPRTWSTCALVNNKIYSIGGYSYGSPTGATNVNEVYDPLSDTWQTLSPMPVSKYGVTRENPVIDGKIYVTHGLDGGFHTDNYVYTPATDSWQQKSSGMNPRDGVQSAVIDNKLYVIAGRNDYINGGTGTNFVEVYDPLQDTGSGPGWDKIVIAHSGYGGLLGARSMGLGDIDSDGDLDITVAIDGRTDGSQGRIFWYQNPGGADASEPALWNEYLITGTIVTGADAQIGDIDKDGNPDIVYAGNGSGADGVWIYYAPQEPNDVTGWSPVKVAGNAYHIYLVDFDTDGDLDILRASAYSSLISWIENPYPADTRTAANWNEFVIEQNSSIAIANRVSAAEIDGDGDLDIGMDADPSGTTGIFKWYKRPTDPRNVGAYEIYTIDQNPAYTAYAHDSCLADLDGDGDIDMAGVGPNSKTVLWWVNDPNSQSGQQYVIDTNKWNNSGAAAINGTVVINTSNAYLRSKTQFQHKAMRCSAQFALYANYGDIGFNTDKVTVGKNDIAFTCFGTPEVRSIVSGPTSYSWGYSSNEGTNWKTWDIRWTPDQVQFYVDDVHRQTHLSNLPLVPLYAQFNTYEGSPTVAVDWISVRDITEPEPQVTVGPGVPTHYTVNISTDLAGSVDPNGLVLVNPGGSIVFNATPNTGYQVSEWIVDSNSVQTGGLTFTMSDVFSNHIVHVTFEPIIVTVSGRVLNPAGVPLEAVLISTNDGMSDVSDPNGLYQLSIEYNWNGTVTPSLADYRFDPANRIYSGNNSVSSSDDYCGRHIADLIADGIINEQDLLAASDNWLSNVEVNNDVMDDGKIDLADLQIIAENWLNEL